MRPQHCSPSLSRCRRGRDEATPSGRCSALQCFPVLCSAVQCSAVLCCHPFHIFTGTGRPVPATPAPPEHAAETASQPLRHREAPPTPYRFGIRSASTERSTSSSRSSDAARSSSARSVSAKLATSPLKPELADATARRWIESDRQSEYCRYAAKSQASRTHWAAPNARPRATPDAASRKRRHPLTRMQRASAA